MEAAQSEGWPVSALNATADAFADRHLRAREFFTTLDHPQAGALEYPGLPFRMLGTPGELRSRPAPGRAHLAGPRRASRLQPGGDRDPAPAWGDLAMAAAGAAASDGARSLAGVRVLAQAIAWAGPFGSMILADLGAEVSEVESIQHLNPTRATLRHFPPSAVAGPRGSLYVNPRHERGLLEPPGLLQLLEAWAQALLGARPPERRVHREQRGRRRRAARTGLPAALGGQPTADHGALPRLRDSRTVPRVQGLALSTPARAGVSDLGLDRSADSRRRRHAATSGGGAGGADGAPVGAERRPSPRRAKLLGGDRAPGGRDASAARPDGALRAARP